MRYALGIDGGGSKCDAALVDEAGEVVGWGRGGPTHVYYDPPEVIAASYTDAVTEALRGVGDAELWVAGLLPEGSPKEAVKAAGRLARHMPASEVDTAFASVQEQWGMVVLSGTGSFVHGRTSHGRDLHFGGLGPVLDDYGSGYAIGLLGLRAAFASGWTPARRTALAEAMPRALGAPSRQEVFRMVYVEGLNRRRIAALSQAVNAEAETGDRVAIQCVRLAADELADLAVDLIRELDMRELCFPAIAIGGVAQRCRIWWDRMCERLGEAAPGIRPVIPSLAPAVGAALLALGEMGVEWGPGLVARLVETQGRVRPAADGEHAA